ncbi:MAG: DUF2752 domain-containing protein [Croceivirga sp.]|mgnify:FL=1
MESVSNVSYMGLQEYMLPCATKQLWGFDCPGCGMQRSILLLLQGDFMAAFEMYPAIFALIPLAFVLILNRLLNFKYANQLIIFLSISSVAMIVINYIIKLLN